MYLPGAIAPSQAADMRARLWRMLEHRGAARDDPSTWSPGQATHLQNIRKRDTDPHDSSLVVDAVRRRLRRWQVDDQAELGTSACHLPHTRAVAAACPALAPRPPVPPAGRRDLRSQPVPVRGRRRATRRRDARAAWITAARRSLRRPPTAGGAHHAPTAGGLRAQSPVPARAQATRPTTAPIGRHGSWMPTATSTASPCASSS